MKIKFEREYGPDVRWSVIVSDFIDCLKEHFGYLSVMQVAYRLLSACAVDNWMHYDPKGKFNAHFAKLVFRENDIWAFTTLMEQREWSLQERLGGYMGPGILPKGACREHSGGDVEFEWKTNEETSDDEGDQNSED